MVVRLSGSKLLRKLVREAELLLQPSEPAVRDHSDVGRASRTVVAAVPSSVVDRAAGSVVYILDRRALFLGFALEVAVAGRVWPAAVVQRYRGLCPRVSRLVLYNREDGRLCGPGELQVHPGQVLEMRLAPVTSDSDNLGTAPETQTDTDPGGSSGARFRAGDGAPNSDAAAPASSAVGSSSSSPLGGEPQPGRHAVLLKRPSDAFKIVTRRNEPAVAYSRVVKRFGGDTSLPPAAHRQAASVLLSTCLALLCTPLAAAQTLTHPDHSIGICCAEAGPDTLAV